VNTVLQAVTCNIKSEAMQTCQQGKSGTWKDTAAFRPTTSAPADGAWSARRSNLRRQNPERPSAIPRFWHGSRRCSKTSRLQPPSAVSLPHVVPTGSGRTALPGSGCHAHAVTPGTESSIRNHEATRHAPFWAPR